MPAKDNENLLHTFDENLVETPPKKMRKIRIGKKTLLTILIVIVVLGAFGYFAVLRPVQTIMARVQTLRVSAEAVSAAAKSQDLGQIKEHTTKVKSDLAEVRSAYQVLGWARFIPFVSNYYLDGQRGFVAADAMIEAGEIGVDAITPYADFIGLKGLATTGDGAKTAQDRITFIVETLDKIKPQLSQIGEKLEVARVEVDKIDPSRYPESFRGIALRSQMIEGIAMLDRVSSLVNDAKPLLESAPYMLGKDKPIRYLVIFQNDAELRPTGGFMTGYAVIEVNKGKISTIESDDIYKLDERFPKRIAAPDPIKKYHPNVPYWYLRDQNLSPDFKASMDVFFPNYELTKSPEVEGIIAVDTQMLVDLMKVTGPIGVPGYGNFSPENDPRCDCPNVFYELQLLAGSEEPVIWDSVSGKIIKAPANYGNRKGFLGPVMYSILSNVMAQPKSKFPLLFNTAISAIDGKHIQLYYTDVEVQKAVESFNMAGRVRDVPEQDYLLVVDTNFSGGKTNIWVKHKVDQVIDVASDGTVTKTVTLTYNNPQGESVQTEGGRKLNGLFRDWLRVYVPKGSELIEAKGFETGQAVGEDLGKTVFEGFFTLAPLNTKTITFKYKLPFKMKSPYKMLIQKQGGTKDFVYNAKINGRAQPELILKSDKELILSY